MTNWYFENGKNIKKFVSNFQIEQKQVRNWLKDEEKTISLRLSEKACRCGTAKLPVMENELYTKFYCYVKAR